MHTPITMHAPHNVRNRHYTCPPCNHACPQPPCTHPCNYTCPPTTHAPTTTHAPCNHAHPHPQPCMPPTTMHAPLPATHTPVDRQTPVKTLPLQTLFVGGNYLLRWHCKESPYSHLDFLNFPPNSRMILIHLTPSRTTAPPWSSNTRAFHPSEKGLSEGSPAALIDKSRGQQFSDGGSTLASFDSSGLWGNVFLQASGRCALA